MEGEGAPLVMMSNLPPDVIQKVLTLMPMRNAFRTSILSQNWRDYCLHIPKLRFDDELFQGKAYEPVSIKCKLLHVVYPILLLHQGPILNFSLRISKLTSCCEIDQIILHLSKSDTLKKFTLLVPLGDEHKLLPAFFKFQQLTVLILMCCTFQPPVTFKGFSRLVRLSFYCVSITEEVFARFISNCPLLKELTLCFATGVMPQKLPTALVHLKSLSLAFLREMDFQAAFLLVTSSPSVETIKFGMGRYPSEAVSQTATDKQDYSHVSLDHLREVEIAHFINMKAVMDFVKLILAKSPMLQKVEIRTCNRVIVGGEVKMVEELLQYPRASARAEIRLNGALLR